MKIQLSAIFMASLLIVPTVYPMHQRTRSKSRQRNAQQLAAQQVEAAAEQQIQPEIAQNSVANLNNETTFTLLRNMLTGRIELDRIKLDRIQKEEEKKARAQRAQENGAWLPKNIRDHRVFKFAEQYNLFYPIQHPIKSAAYTIATAMASKWMVKYLMVNSDTFANCMTSLLATAYSYSPAGMTWLAQQAAYFW